MKLTKLHAHLGAATLALTVVSTIAVILGCAETKSAQQAPPAANAPAPSAQCAKDTDCKGDRICQNGACVSPR